MDLISIIIPVYNVEKFLDKCIKSILEQSYRNLEIILVDDGSTDNSGNICEKYKFDERITVYHKENGGLSSARNYGIKRSKGEYLSFIDSDDYIDKYFIENLYTALKNSPDSCKISMCGFTRKENTFSDFNGDPEIINSMEVLKNILYQNNDDLFSVAAWNKLYHKSVFENILYPLGKLNEDMFVVCEILSETENIAVIDYKGYYYRINNSSITQKKFKPKNMDVIEACDHILKHIEKKRYPSNINKAAINLKFRRSYQMLYKIWLSDEKYEEYEKILYSFLKASRMTILKDENSKKSSKLTAAILFTGKIPFKICTKFIYRKKGE